MFLLKFLGGFVVLILFGYNFIETTGNAHNLYMQFKCEIVAKKIFLKISIWIIYAIRIHCQVR